MMRWQEKVPRHYVRTDDQKQFFHRKFEFSEFHQQAFSFINQDGYILQIPSFPTFFRSHGRRWEFFLFDNPQGPICAAIFVKAENESTFNFTKQNVDSFTRKKLYLRHTL